MTRRVIKHNEYARRCYKNKRVIVGGKEVPILKMLNSARLMNKYVSESPGKAETLFYALRDNPLFDMYAKALGDSFCEAYRDDTGRDASVKHIRLDIGRLESVLA